MTTRQAHKVLFVFIDGFGLGPDDPELNPLVAAHMPWLHGLLGGPLTEDSAEMSRDGLLLRRLDATLGYGGRPQSATGQTTLLTGLNGAAAMGRHYGPWPGPTLLALLDHDTLFHRAQAIGGAALANAYPSEYFEALKGRRLRSNAPVVAARSAQVELRDLTRYRAGEAVAADIDGSRFAAWSSDLAEQGARGAAEVLANIASRATFTFFDVWTSDALGHAQDHAGALRLLTNLDVLLGGLQAAASDVTVVVTSDHGNLEDLSSSRHTVNAVPLLVLGPGASEFAGATSLLDVAPAITRLWSVGSA